MPERRHGEINQRNSGLRRQVLNLRPDLVRLVPDGLGFDAGEIVELLLPRLRFVSEQERVDERAALTGSRAAAATAGESAW